MQKDQLERTMFYIERERWGTSPVPQPVCLLLVLMPHSLAELGHQPASLCTVYVQGHLQ